MDGIEQTTGEFAPASLTAAGALGLLAFVAGCAAGAYLLTRFLLRPPPFDRRLRHIRARPWRAGHTVAAVAAIVGAQCATLLLAPTDSEGMGVGQMLLQTLLFHGVGAAVVWALLRHEGLDLRHAFGMQARFARRDTRWAVVAYLTAVPVVTVCSFLFGLLLQALDYPVEPQDVVTLLAQAEQPPWMRAYLMLLAVAVAPVVEEMLFRGLALPVLIRTVGLRAAVLLVSALFALMHAHLPSVVPLFLISIGFSLAYVATGSLTVAIVMHAVFNAVNVSSLFALRHLFDVS
jgi:membrane protease YdiL (CAAX protease family)